MTTKTEDAGVGQSHLLVRGKICDAFLIAIALIALPTLAASLYRVTSIGWQPVMAIHIAVVLVLWLTTLLRRRLPYVWRAGYALFLLVVVGLGGIWQFNLMAGGVAFLVIAPALGTVLFGLRGGMAVLGATILPAIAIGFATVADQRLPPFDIGHYLTSPTTWSVAIFAWIFTGLSSVVAFNVFNTFLVRALDNSRRQARALQESERDYRSILGNLVDIFVRLDLEGRILMASPSAIKLFGHTPEQLQGEPLANLCLPPQQCEQLMERLAEEHGRIGDYELAMRDRDGTPRWVSVSAHYWIDAEGQLRGVEGLLHDITARKATEKALQQAQRMEAMGQMTGGVAHDFNNLLGVMLGNTELLAMKTRDIPGTAIYTERLRAAIERAATLTQRLLAFSRQQPLSPARHDVGGLLRNLRDMLDAILGETIELQVAVAEDIHPVMVDAAQLDHALVNLALNARDAMPQGGSLRISAVNTHLDEEYASRHDGVQPGDYVEICITDTGQGMPPEVLARACEPFFTTKDVGKGSGLGLSTAYGFAKQSGGHIRLFSEPGRGTTIKLYLPCHAAGKDEQSPGAAHVEPAIGSECILIVEDDPSVRAIPVTVLRDQGYEILEAGDGREALQHLQDRQDIGLLFTDIVLPDGMSGVDVAREALRLHPGIKILYTTGYPDNHLPSAEQLDVIEKPYRVAELLSRVRTLLDEHGR